MCFIVCPSFSITERTYKEVTRDDIMQFLDSLRKPEESDPLHKWIGTYNIYRVLLIRFFKWLYYLDIEQKKRPKPSVIENIPQLKRREQLIYKPSDLWSMDDDLLFLKYCPIIREKCYHMISRDLGCRPNEIFKLKIIQMARGLHLVLVFQLINSNIASSTIDL